MNLAWLIKFCRRKEIKIKGKLLKSRQNRINLFGSFVFIVFNTNKKETVER